MIVRGVSKYLLFSPVANSSNTGAGSILRKWLGYLLISSNGYRNPRIANPRSFDAIVRQLFVGIGLIVGTVGSAYGGGSYCVSIWTNHQQTTAATQCGFSSMEDAGAWGYANNVFPIVSGDSEELNPFWYYAGIHYFSVQPYPIQVQEVSGIYPGYTGYWWTAGVAYYSKSGVLESDQPWSVMPVGYQAIPDAAEDPTKEVNNENNQNQSPATCNPISLATGDKFLTLNGWSSNAYESFAPLQLF